MDPLLRASLPWLALFFAGLALLLAAASIPLRRSKPELVREIWTRYVSWGGLAAVMVLALAAGRGWWILLVTLLAVVGFREYVRAVGLWMDRGVQAVVYGFIALTGLVCWWPWDGPVASPEAGWYGLFAILPMYAIVAILTLAVVRGEPKGMIQRTALGVLGYVYLGWFLGHYAYLVNLRPGAMAGGVGLILFVTFVTALNDVGAFWAGKLFGRNRMRPHLSPGKTWEGFVGSLAVVLATAFVVWPWVPFYSWQHLVVVALLLAVGSTVGDLAMSAMKRDLGIKDWGRTLPGHGGFLDRLNSLVFTAPILFHYTRFFYG